MQTAASRLFIAVAFLLGPSAAEACTCEGHTRPACQAVWEAAMVFSGEVLDITPVIIQGRQAELMQKLRDEEARAGREPASPPQAH